SEAAFMRTCETALDHRLTRGSDRTIAELRTHTNEQLMLSDYMSHLSIPPAYRLEHYHLGDRAKLDVTVESYRWLLLEARCKLAHAWYDTTTQSSGPSFHWSLIFLRTANPAAPGLVAPEDKLLANDISMLLKAPDSMNHFVKVKEANGLEPAFGGKLTLR